MKLYHGSDMPIIQIDLSRCTPYKDFGKGFYTTSISRHAEERSLHIAAENQGSPVTTIFDFDETYLVNGALSVKRFLTPSREWVEFVMRCRDRNIPQPPHHYDVVEGPIANDKMRVQFSLFERGIIDMETTLRRITYIEDTHQISFHTLAAVALLKPEPDYPKLLIETAIGKLAQFLVEDRNLSVTEALNMVYNSAVYEKLTNRATALYQESSAYIYELLKREIS
ncbi:MAG: DUF3990 domain-containing protein [Tannerellaceae bacterium]|jgi:hypothetical protein|nr:DUF3990 domain-containing protein [Tannerellaceae bacterium]